jgi:hypothetical protein
MRQRWCLTLANSPSMSDLEGLMLQLCDEWTGYRRDLVSCLMAVRESPSTAAYNVRQVEREAHKMDACQYERGSTKLHTYRHTAIPVPATHRLLSKIMAPSSPTERQTRSKLTPCAFTPRTRV